MQSTRRGSFSVRRSEKPPGSKYSSTSGLSPRLSQLDLELEKRPRLGPVTPLEAELNALVDHKLPVVAQRDLDPLQRPRSRTLEVDPGLAETAAVAGAFKLVLRIQPVRGTAEMRADRKERVKSIRLVDDPDALFLFPPFADGSDRVFLRRTGLEDRDRLEEYPGEHKASERHAADTKPSRYSTPPCERTKITPRPAGPTTLLRRRDHVIFSILSGGDLIGHC